jgi:hypothetical protein
MTAADVVIEATDCFCSASGRCGCRHKQQATASERWWCTLLQEHSLLMVTGMDYVVMTRATVLLRMV